MDAGKSDTDTTLYRAVSLSELADIVASKGFRSVPASMEGKWFAESPGNAAEWGKRLYQQSGSVFHIIRIDLPDHLASQMYRIENLDRIGPARYADADLLEKINQARPEIRELSGV